MNDFDELIGADVAGQERERLLAVHTALVESGPPPELPASLHDVPEPGKVSVLRKQTAPRKIVLVAAAVIVLGLVFTAGYSMGLKTDTSAKPARSIELKGTLAAPHAEGILDVQRQVSGNLPMSLEVTGLPPVTAPEYYVVWLMRNGQRFAPCGSFVVSKPVRTLTVTLNAPYALEKGDTWIVTRQTYGSRPMTPTPVLAPV